MSNKPDWKDAPDWAKWIAQDEDGSWCYYQGKPVKRRAGWIQEMGTKYEECGSGNYNENWIESVEQRP